MRVVIIRSALYACCTLCLPPLVLAGVPTGPDESSGDLDALARSLARMFHIGRWPMRAEAEAAWYAKTADRFGVEWQCLISLSTVLGPH